VLSFFLEQFIIQPIHVAHLLHARCLDRLLCSSSALNMDDIPHATCHVGRLLLWFSSVFLFEKCEDLEADTRGGVACLSLEM